jgi:hypothetical protein
MRWPWITIVLAALLALNPIGLAVLGSAFLSGEALSRNIWGPIALIAALVLAVLGLLEHLMWKAIKSRPNFPPPPPVATSGRADGSDKET